MDFRRALRWIVNILSIVVAVLAIPELVAVLPAGVLAIVATVTPAINMILSWLRPLVPPEAE